MEKLIVKHVIKTDVGLLREVNEDAAGFAPSENLCGNGDLFVVCDGMGGHVGGAIASQTAVQSIIDFFSNEFLDNPYVALNDAINFANEQIFARSQVEAALKGMGTTCTVALIRGSEVFFGHVGDSRIYIYNDNSLFRITKDHSFVQQLVDQGVIKDEDAESHPRKNELLRALGIRAEVQAEIAGRAIRPKAGDTILMCSDGLCGLVEDKLLEKKFNENKSIEELGEILIDEANNNGGPDNITATLISILESPHEESEFQDMSPQSEELEKTDTMDFNSTEIIDIVEKKKSVFNRPLLYVFSLLAAVALALVLFFIFVGDKKDVLQNITSVPVVNIITDCEDGKWKHEIRIGDVASKIIEDLAEASGEHYKEECLRYFGTKDNLEGSAVKSEEDVKEGELILLDCRCLDSLNQLIEEIENNSIVENDTILDTTNK